MAANDGSLLVVKLRFRSLQRPVVISVGSRLANIDLRAGRVRLQDHFLTGGRLDFVRHIGR
jgi:hypothetical protein